MGKIFRKDLLKILILCVAIISCWQLYIRFSTLSQVQQDLWGEFLKIQEPARCTLVNIEEFSWWKGRTGGKMLFAYYKIEKREKVRELSLIIQKNGWYRNKELYDSENEKRGNYYFVKPAKYAYLYLEYDDNKNRVKLTIGSNK